MRHKAPMDPQLQAAIDDARMVRPRQIPRDFLLGAATASFQIEGAAGEDGRGPSIWDTFCKVPGAVVGGDNGDVATDHYHRYREDVALMKRLGLDSYRFSIAWPRVCPDGVKVNQKGLDFYSRLVDELLEADILPWLTLYHWDLPQALQDRGGWPNRDTAYWFRDYSMHVYEALGDRVPVWTTLNEPWVSAFLGHTAGAHAPGHQSLEEGMLSSHHLLLGHGLVINEIRDDNPALNLGLTLNLTYAQPLNPRSVADQRAAILVDGQNNRWFLDPLFRGSYPVEIREEFAEIDPAGYDRFEAAIRPGDMDVISTHIDALGINYYQGDIVAGSDRIEGELAERLGTTRLTPAPTMDSGAARPTKNPSPASEGIFFPESGLPRSAQDWENDPILLKELLLRVDREYSGPAGTALYVTENGTAVNDTLVQGPDGPAVHDPRREAFIELHLGAALDAKNEGADVRGFFYWSLLDNFEWAWGYDKRFGIVYVNFETGERTVKDSGLLYSKIMKSRELNVAPDAGLLVRRGTIVEGRAGV